jgi:hypothetical protein
MFYSFFKIQVTVIIGFLLVGSSGCMMTPPCVPPMESRQVCANPIHRQPLIRQPHLRQQQQPQQQWVKQNTPQQIQQNWASTPWYDPFGLLGSPTRLDSPTRLPVQTLATVPVNRQTIQQKNQQKNQQTVQQIIQPPNRQRSNPENSPVITKSNPIAQVAYQSPQPLKQPLQQPLKRQIRSVIPNTANSVASPELYQPWNLDNYRVKRSVSNPYRLVADTQESVSNRIAPPAMNPDQLLMLPQQTQTTNPVNITATSEKASLLNLGRDLVKEFQPSNDRKWSQNHAVLQTAEFNGNWVTVHNIRYSKYETEEQYTTQYYDATFDLNDIQTIDLVVVPFRGLSRLAHVESSFGFADGRHLGMSIEARYEEGERYDPLGAGLRQFELIYVLADERDMIRLGTDINKNDVHIYRLNIEAGEVRTMFVDALQRANKLAKNPEFYHPLTNSCVTNLIGHINKGKPKAIPKEYRTLLPGLMDHYVYDLKLVDTAAKTFQEAKENAKVNWLVEKFGDLEYFSAGIRQNMY